MARASTAIGLAGAGAAYAATVRADRRDRQNPKNKFNPHRAKVQTKRVVRKYRNRAAKRNINASTVRRVGRNTVRTGVIGTLVLGPHIGAGMAGLSAYQTARSMKMGRKITAVSPRAASTRRGRRRQRRDSKGRFA